MKNILNTLLVTGALLFLSSCSNEDDFTVIEDYIPVVVGENFESFYYTSSGSNEVYIDTDGWLNVNFSGNGRLWNVKEYDDNQFGEFSSYYSSSSDNDDDVWLITPKMDFATSTNTESLSFKTLTRYANSATLTVLISSDFDGTEAGISTATWDTQTVDLPSQDQEWVESGTVDLSAYQEFSSVYVAFRYQGSKSAGATTTFQIDNIRIFENK